MRLVFSLILAIALCAGGAQAQLLGEFDSGENWLVNGGRFTGEHFSPLTGINDGDVEKLGLAWAADVPTFTLSAEPLVVDGVIYLSGSLSHVYAFDAATGAPLWRFVPEVRLDFSYGTSYAARTNRGVAVWKGKVYVGTGDCRLIAIDAARGKQLWEAPVCDPTDGDGPGHHCRAPGRRRQGVHGLCRFRFLGTGLGDCHRPLRYRQLVRRGIHWGKRSSWTRGRHELNSPGSPVGRVRAVVGVDSGPKACCLVFRPTGRIFWRRCRA